jgi:hypothetical protein
MEKKQYMKHSLQYYKFILLPMNWNIFSVPLYKMENLVDWSFCFKRGWLILKALYPMKSSISYGELYFLCNVTDFNKMFLQLTNMTCSAFPFHGALAHISVPQILASATITASTSVTVTVFQVTGFPFPSITTCTQEIGYAICAATIVTTWVGGAFILICEIASTSTEIQLLKGGINAYSHIIYYIALPYLHHRHHLTYL